MIKTTTFSNLPVGQIFYLHPDHARFGERLWCKISDSTGEQRPKVAKQGGRLLIAATREVWIRA